MTLHRVKLYGLALALALFAIATGYSGYVGLAQSGKSALASPTKLSVTSYADLVRFTAQGKFQVEVFTLAGLTVFSRSNQNTLDWNTATVPNGVYLYTFTIDGNKQIGKVAVVRGQGVLAPSLVTLPSVGQIAIPQHTGSWDLDHGANAYTLNASNFGFGTQTPTQYFQIVTPSGLTIRPMELDAGSSTVAPCLYMKNGLASPSTYHFCTWSTGDKFSFTRTGVADYIVIDRTGASPNIQLLNANVGIGASNPTEKLQVSGSGVVRASIDSDSNAGVRLDLRTGQFSQFISPQWSVATVSSGDFQIYDETGGVNRLYIKTDTGNVGIGTITPTAKLHVEKGDAGLYGTNTAITGECATNNCTAVFGRSSGSFGVGVFGSSTNGGNALMADLDDGSCTSSTLDCNIFVGQTQATNMARIDKTGKGFFEMGTQTGGADFAESMRTTDNPATLQPGDVLVIDSQSPRAVRKSTQANSTLVAGVYSTKPSVLSIADHHIDDSLEGEVAVGVVGIIPTKVTTENGPIQIGDLLVTSSTPGHAMRAPANPAPGTILGKALGSLESGAGIIEVLVTIR